MIMISIIMIIIILSIIITNMIITSSSKAQVQTTLYHHILISSSSASSSPSFALSSSPSSCYQAHIIIISDIIITKHMHMHMHITTHMHMHMLKVYHAAGGAGHQEGAGAFVGTGPHFDVLDTRSEGPHHAGEKKTFWAQALLLVWYVLWCRWLYVIIIL